MSLLDSVTARSLILRMPGARVKTFVRIRTPRIARTTARFGDYVIWAISVLARR
jgi:hypothetical protein